MKSETIHIVITGGTIDSYFEATKDTIVPNKKTIIPETLQWLKVDKKFHFSKVCMKDSRALTEKDRQAILSAVQKSPYKKIIITHGTYTMPDTARYLKERLKISNKAVVFTGSMLPISGFSPSDGTFNLGYAIAVSEYMRPGIYIAMNGRIFDPLRTVKDLTIGKFSSKS